jgi:hypothetical protein
VGPLVDVVDLEGDEVAPLRRLQLRTGAGAEDDGVALERVLTGTMSGTPARATYASRPKSR